MNEMWLIGVLGGGAGIALGAPILVRGAVERKDAGIHQLSGLWLVNGALAMLLIALRHGPLFSRPVDALLGHATNVMNLLAWPGLVVITRLLTGADAGWWGQRGRGFAPASLYVIAVSALGLVRVPFELLLPLGFVCVVQIVQVCRGVPPDTRLARYATAIAGFALAQLLAQTLRTVFSDVAAIREIVPMVMTTSFIAIAFAIGGSARIPLAKPDAERPRYARSGMSSEKAIGLLADLDRGMEADFWFRDTTLSLRALADRLGVSPQAVSQTLNQQRGLTLTAYMGEWRIRDVIARLADPANDCFTVEALAQRSGFASRSAFYTAFKRREGMTPTEYRLRLRIPPR